MSTVDLVFDLDGTLVDSVFVCARIANQMLKDRGFPETVTLAQMRRTISIGGTSMIAALLGSACRDPEKDIREFRARYAELPTPPQSLFPGVAEGLFALAVSGHRLSICSNKPQGLCEKVLSELGLAHHFAAVVGGDQVRPQKPDPVHLEHTLQRAGGRDRRCVYVGDSEVDVQLAQNARVPLILVTYGYGDFPSPPAGAAPADTFAQVPGLVEEQVRALASLEAA